jgi:hypothetical protein
VAVQRCAHDFFHHVEGSKGSGIDQKQTISARKQFDLPLSWLILPDNAISCEGFSQDRSCLILMNFVFPCVNDVKVVFSQALKTAQILLTDRVALVEGGALELAGAYLGNIMGQFGAHGLF